MFRVLIATLMLVGILTAQEGVPRSVHHCDYDDDTRFSVFMSTLLHQIEYYNEDLMEHEIAIVVNGFCTRYLSPKLKDVKFSQMLESRIENYDVKVYVCKSGMQASGVKESDVAVKGVELVPNGSAKLTELQGQGFAYIKTQ